MEAFVLPLLSIRHKYRALFPGLPQNASVGRPTSLAAIKRAQADGGRIMVVGQKNPDASEMTRGILWPVGTEAIIKDVVETPGKGVHVFYEGLRRAHIRSVKRSEDYIAVTYELIIEPPFEMTEHLATLAMRLQSEALRLRDTFMFRPMARPDSHEALGRFLDIVAHGIRTTDHEQVSILGMGDARKRIEMLNVILTRLTQEEDERTAEEMAREAAQTEEKKGKEEEKAAPPPKFAEDPKTTELQRLKKAVDGAGLSEEAMALAQTELRRLQTMSSSASEYAVAVTYLDTLASLPWNKATEDRINVTEAKKVLDEDHYGLKEPKERILEFLAVRKLAPNEKGAILCFAGPPGVGKTSLGRSIARATGRKFIRMSLGGLGDEAEIRGHRRTYVGARPGKIIQQLRQVGTKNPVFMLDEVDKLGHDFRGDPAAALLEVLDPEQNGSFRDNYLEAGFDLSQVLFITTVNNSHAMLPALHDRMDIIDIPGYSAFAKLNIAKKHLIPKQKRKNGLEGYKVDLTDEAVEHIVEAHTGESGVRELERKCATVLRKITVRVAAGEEPPALVGAEEVGRLLGPPKTIPERMAERPEVGLSTGLAWTDHGGSILKIESSLVPGDGKLELITGNLGQVLQESVKVVHTWVREHADELGVDSELLKTRNIHVHFPSGGTPKDGPSAGVAIAASVVSLLTGIPVRNDLAMTGEISLRGRVMPVGGIPEKVMAAHRAGIREVVLPKANEPLLRDIPEEVLDDMRVRLVDSLAEAVGIAVPPKKESIKQDVLDDIDKVFEDAGIARVDAAENFGPDLSGRAPGG